MEAFAVPIRSAVESETSRRRLSGHEPQDSSQKHIERSDTFSRLGRNRLRQRE